MLGNCNIHSVEPLPLGKISGPALNPGIKAVHLLCKETITHNDLYSSRKNLILYSANNGIMFNIRCE